MSAGPEGYRLVISQAVMARLRECAQQADQAGRSPQYRETLLAAHQALRTSPQDWGDPQFSLHNLGLLVCHRYVGGFHVSYAIDADNRVVYLREITLILPTPPEHPGHNGAGG
jgi:hypothetical protein